MLVTTVSQYSILLQYTYIRAADRVRFRTDGCVYLLLWLFKRYFQSEKKNYFGEKINDHSGCVLSLLFVRARARVRRWGAAALGHGCLSTISHTHGTCKRLMHAHIYHADFPDRFSCLLDEFSSVMVF